MLSLNKNTLYRIERSLSNILNGMPLEEWAESIVLQLLRTVGQINPPTKLTNQLLKERKIIDVRCTPGLPEKGRLSIGDNGFIVEIASKGPYGLWYRWFLAHEIAHTFFYDIGNWPPKPKTYLEPGNPDLERLCWHLASCLLVPASWLQAELEKIPQFGSKLFSVTVLDKLEKIFLTSWRMVAQRLVQDLNLWSCIALQFTNFGHIPPNSHSEFEWRLTWQTRPNDIDKVIYIPFGHRTEQEMKYPRATGALAKFITECFKSAKDKTSYFDNLPLTVLKSSTTGNLGKYLYNIYEKDVIPFYYLIKNRTDNRTFNSLDMISHKGQYVVLWFPLKASLNFS